MERWPLRYRVYAPIHRLLSRAGTWRFLGKYPLMIVRNKLNRILFTIIFTDPSMREVHTIRGFRIHVLANDQAAASLMFNGDYSPLEVDNAIKHMENLDTFVDVGANYGYLSFAVLSATDCIAIAIEPTAQLAECIRTTSASNPEMATRIKIVEAACGQEQGLVYLDVDPHLTSNTTVSESGTPVHMTTLDALSESLLGDLYLKIDVEGLEYSVIQGGREILTRATVVQCEVSDTMSFDALVAVGYAAAMIDGTPIRYRPRTKHDLMFTRSRPERSL